MGTVASWVDGHDAFVLLSTIIIGAVLSSSVFPGLYGTNSVVTSVVTRIGFYVYEDLKKCHIVVARRGTPHGTVGTPGVIPVVSPVLSFKESASLTVVSVSPGLTTNGSSTVTGEVRECEVVPAIPTAIVLGTISPLTGLVPRGTAVGASIPTTSNAKACRVPRLLAFYYLSLVYGWRQMLCCLSIDIVWCRLSS